MKGMSFDPGAHCGWAAGEQHRPGERVEALGCGVLDRGISDGIDDRVAEAYDLIARFRPDVILVETVSFVFPREGFGPDMAGNLVRASRLGGRIYQLSEDHGYPTAEVSAEQWRKAIVGKASPENNEITPVIMARYLNWPKRSNNHERDAGGLLAFGLDAVLRTRARIITSALLRSIFTAK